MFVHVIATWYAALRIYLTFGLLRRSRRKVQIAQPRVSVVVAARNEAAHLPHLLTALLNQTYPNYEVVLVDDRSTDATDSILRAWQHRDGRLQVIRIDTVPPDRSPKMHALTQGIAQCDGDVILLTDADCNLPPTWIAGMLACFDADVGAVIGYVALEARAGAVFEQVQAVGYFAMMALTAGATKWGQPLGAAGANLAYRRAAYMQTGGFAALPPGSVADDMALLQRVLDHTDWRVVWADESTTFVRSHAVPTLRQLFHQRVRWAAGGGEVLHHNRLLLITSALIGTVNGMLACFPIFLRHARGRRLLCELLLARIGADVLHLGIAAVQLGAARQLLYLPLWLPCHIMSSNLLPLYALIAKWRWK